MMNVSPYLHFDGNAEEALNTYSKILHGTVEMLMRFKEGPGTMGAEHPNRIMHSALRIGATQLMLSDSMEARTAGSNFHVSLQIEHDIAQAEAIFSALAEGGSVRIPFAPSFWGAHFGMLVDRFGIGWMINCESTVTTVA